jgi:NADPH-dependent glutamate synthase beta subunit-like oxidoreductase
LKHPIGHPETGRTNRDRLWAGGDIVTGAAKVIVAMGVAKRSALDMLTTFGIPCGEDVEKLVATDAHETLVA